jgi:uncharacterized protein YcfJ
MPSLKEYRNRIEERTVKKIAIVALLFLTGCTTPMTTLKNPKTGQIATCGGSATGSLVGGVIGYQIQKGNDGDCIQAYKKQGFKIEDVKE